MKRIEGLSKYSKVYRLDIASALINLKLQARLNDLVHDLLSASGRRALLAFTLFQIECCVAMTFYLSSLHQLDT